MKEQRKSNNKGITLIALVISIIVMLILAGVSINAVVGEDGILSKAQKSSITTRLATYKEELELNLVEEYEDANNINCVGETIKKYIPSIEGNEIDSFVIYRGKLMYIGNDTIMKEVANNLQIENGSENSKDIVQVTDEINKICVSVTPPKNDSEATPEKCVGIRLYDKNNQNATNWRLVIEYNSKNEPKARYGSGFFLLKAGTIIGNGIEVKNDYVINYSTNEIVLLSNYKEWSLSSQLAVTDGIVMNLDAKNLSDGKWTGVVKHGDLNFNTEKNSLYFDGDGDYLELTASSNFTKGFTLEMYMNLDRYVYNNGSGRNWFGILCKVDDMFSPTGLVYRRGMRIGSGDQKILGYFWEQGHDSSLPGGGHGVYLDKEVGFEVGKDIFLTYVYRRSQDYTAEEKTKLNWSKTNLDKIDVYVDGVLKSTGYQSPTTYSTRFKFI